MTGVLLDGTALVETLRPTPSRAFVRHLSQVPTAQRWTTVMVISELTFHARVTQSASLHRDLLKLITAIRVLPFDMAAGQSYARLLQTENWVANAFSAVELMTLAVAQSRNLTLVSRRAAWLQRMPGVRVEDWSSP